MNAAFTRLERGWNDMNAAFMSFEGGCRAGLVTMPFGIPLGERVRRRRHVDAVIPRAVVRHDDGPLAQRLVNIADAARDDGSGASMLAEPGGSAVAPERRDIRNDAQFEGLPLDLRRKLACVHDQAVYLDEPDHGARVDDVNA